MTYYRIYCFDRDQHIQSFAETHCETDAEALNEALELITRYPRVEVWDRGRQVHRLDSQTAPVASLVAGGERRGFGSFLSLRRGSQPEDRPAA